MLPCQSVDVYSTFFYTPLWDWASMTQDRLSQIANQNRACQWTFWKFSFKNSWGNLHFCNWSNLDQTLFRKAFKIKTRNEPLKCCRIISANHHLINLPFYQLVILSSRLFINWSFHQIVIFLSYSSTTGRFIN